MLSLSFTSTFRAGMGLTKTGDIFYLKWLSSRIRLMGSDKYIMVHFKISSIFQIPKAYDKEEFF